MRAGTALGKRQPIDLTIHNESTLPSTHNLHSASKRPEMKTSSSQNTLLQTMTIKDPIPETSEPIEVRTVFFKPKTIEQMPIPKFEAHIKEQLKHNFPQLLEQQEEYWWEDLYEMAKLRISSPIDTRTIVQDVLKRDISNKKSRQEFFPPKPKFVSKKDLQFVRESIPRDEAWELPPKSWRGNRLQWIALKRQTSEA